MGFPTTEASPVESPAMASDRAPGWGRVSSVVLRFFFSYWLLYSLPVILSFPTQLVSMIVAQIGRAGQTAAEPMALPTWLNQTMSYLGYPATWFQQAMNGFTPWVSQTILGVEVSPPSNFTGSGDRLFDYCTAFACLVLAITATVVWTAAGELWRRLRSHRPPNYDRLNVLFRGIVRFHLMYQMLVYGALKVWCAQFPPISDFQLDVKYGDSSPMGLLWRFMQFSQPYTSITGIVEFTCGVLLISRRTSLLGALCAFGATLQVFLLNMCYDVPVKLMSGHLLLMALTLIVPDAPRLFRLLVLGRAVGPRPLTPLFGGWKWLNRSAVVLRTAAYAAFGGLFLYQAYTDAATHGILAPENPMAGRWIGKEFVRDGQKVPFPEQPENPPPRQVTPSKWQGGPGMPAVVRVAVSGVYVTLMFEDGSGVSYRNLSSDRSELALVRAQGGGQGGKLRVSFPEPGAMVLEGPFDGQDIRMSLRRVPLTKRDYLLRDRGFHWVQETPFNR